MVRITLSLQSYTEFYSIIGYKINENNKGTNVTANFKAVLASVTILSGCAYTSYTTPLNPVETKSTFSKTEKSEPYVKLSVDGNEHFVSIGDNLFIKSEWINVTTHQVIIPYRGIKGYRLPSQTYWIAHSKYQEDAGESYKVYTTSSYYKGTIGIILDEDYYPKTDKPFVQVSGLKKGRRWEVTGSGPFFVDELKTVEEKVGQSWGLRFGGLNNDMYIFEIINQSESTVVEVLQTIKVTEKDFFDGFVVRGILVKGTEPYKSGIIKYRVQSLQ